MLHKHWLKKLWLTHLQSCGLTPHTGIMCIGHCLHRHRSIFRRPSDGGQQSQQQCGCDGEAGVEGKGDGSACTAQPHGLPRPIKSQHAV